MWIRIAKADLVMVGLPDRVWRYRQHAGSAIRQRVQMQKAYVHVLERHIEPHGTRRQMTLEALRRTCNRLMLDLAAGGQTAEASRFADKCLACGRTGVLTMVQVTILRMFPRLFHMILRVINRIANTGRKAAARLSRIDGPL